MAATGDHISGQGTATISVAAASNTQSTSRTGGIVVSDQRLSVTQDGRDGCSITLTGPGGTLAATGGQGSLAVGTLSGCAWTITSSAPWLVPNVTSGSGSASVPYQVQPNTSGFREATLSVGSQAFTVSQAAAPAASPCSYSIDRPTQAFPSSGGRPRCSSPRSRPAHGPLPAETRGSPLTQTRARVTTACATPSCRTCRSARGRPP